MSQNNTNALRMEMAKYAERLEDAGSKLACLQDDQELTAEIESYVRQIGLAIERAIALLDTVSSDRACKRAVLVLQDAKQRYFDASQRLRELQ